MYIIDEAIYFESNGRSSLAFAKNIYGPEIIYIYIFVYFINNLISHNLAHLS